MVKKIIYTIKSFIILGCRLKYPFILLNYLWSKSVYLTFKDGISLLTNHWLEAVVAKETIIDDDYQLSLLLQSVRQPVRLIVDVGAGIGDFAIFCAKKFPQAKIIAIEPNKHQYKLFQENIRLNRITNIKTYNAAIGTKTVYDLSVPSANVHASTVSLNKKVKKTKVVGKRLDSFIINRIDFVKIDCEGAEIDILKSITPKKIRLVRRFVIEYHNHIIQDEDKKILDILKKFRFKLRQQQNSIIPQTGYIFAESI